MKNTIDTLIKEGPGSSMSYGGRYVVHWALNAGDHAGRPMLSLSSEGTKIQLKIVEMWARALKKAWGKPCKVLTELNVPITTTYRNGKERSWFVSRLIIYEREDRANGATQLYLF